MTTKADLAALGHEPMPALKAIRAKCLDCSGGNRAEVEDCLVRRCPLYPFRLGSNPWKAEPSDARREAGRRLAALKKPRPIAGENEKDTPKAEG